MLKRENRLISKFEFNVSKKYGKPFRGDYSSGYVLKPREYTGPTKVGIVVSGRVHKRATKRNRIKRQFSEIITKRLNKMGSGLWWVIYPKTSCLGAKYENIDADFDKTLQEMVIPN